MGEWGAGHRKLGHARQGRLLGGQQEAGSGAGKRPIQQALCPPPGLRAQLPGKGPRLRPVAVTVWSHLPVPPFPALRRRGWGQGMGASGSCSWARPP